MLNVLYLVHDLADPAVRRRVLVLKTGGAAVTLAGFRRGENRLADVEGVRAIELGTTQDGRFVRRAGAVARACLNLRTGLRAVSRPDVIVARNLEMLAVANRAVSLFAGAVPVVYECLDIHRLLLRRDVAGAALRTAEAWLGRNVRLLLTSSPAFVENYFRPLSGIEAPVHLVENQVLDLDGVPPIAEGPSPGEPWTIGWFGAVRCRKSLALLAAFTRHMEGRFEVVIRGRPAYSEFDDFDRFVAGEPHIRFHGPYRNPEDLPDIYGKVHFTWAIDFFEEGLNSSWLLPNRLYEGCRHGAVPIVMAGTQTARFAADKGIGIEIGDATADYLAAAFGALDESRFAARKEALRRVDPRTWTFDRADCIALVRRIAALTGAPRQAEPDAASYPDLIATRVDYHDR